MKFEPKEKVRVKSVDGTIIETHGSLKATVREGQVEVTFTCQLVSNQVDIQGDGILGWDFFHQMQAQICYKSQILMFKYGGALIKKRLIRDQIGMTWQGYKKDNTAKEVRSNSETTSSYNYHTHREG